MLRESADTEIFSSTPAGTTMGLHMGGYLHNVTPSDLSLACQFVKLPDPLKRMDQRASYLKEREWGQMGVTMTAGTEGWIIEAPAATA